MKSLVVKMRGRRSTHSWRPCRNRSMLRRSRSDENKAATAEVAVRGTLAPDAAGPGKGGWPTYTLTVSQVFKTPKDVRIEPGQKLSVKTIKEFKGPVTLYLVFDKDQKLYRLQDPTGERGFSHADAAGGLAFDSLRWLLRLQQVRGRRRRIVRSSHGPGSVRQGVWFGLRDERQVAPSPKDAFKSLVVVTAIKRGAAAWAYKVEAVSAKDGTVELRYAAMAKASETPPSPAR